MPEIVISPRGKSPFGVELAVFEEDTWRLLSPGNVAGESRQATSELIADMTEFQPAPPGQLIVKGNIAYGIVHDLDNSPSWRPEWIHEVLDQLVGYCRATGIRSIAIQPLGCIYGNDNIDAFVDELNQVPGIENLARIWVMS